MATMRAFHTACPYTSLPICYCQLYDLVEGKDTSQLQEDAMMSRVMLSKSRWGFLPQDVIDRDATEKLLSTYAQAVKAAEDMEEVMETKAPSEQPESEAEAEHKSLKRLAEHLDEQVTNSNSTPVRRLPRRSSTRRGSYAE